MYLFHILSPRVLAIPLLALKLFFPETFVPMSANIMQNCSETSVFIKLFRRNIYLWSAGDDIKRRKPSSIGSVSSNAQDKSNKLQDELASRDLVPSELIKQSVKRRRGPTQPSVLSLTDAA